MQLLNRTSAFFARYKGLPTMVAVLLVVLNFILRFFPGLGWLATSDLFLHLGVIIGLVGILLAEALG